MSNFTFVPQYTFGISTNDVNIYSKKRIVGYIEAKDVPAFSGGNTDNFRPIPNWKNTFSFKLAKQLNLTG